MNELKKLPRIIRQCRTIGEIPTSYKVSLTYEEQLMWFCRFLEEEVIPVVNNNSQVVQELKTYVEEYFNNLDVQEEINNKLEAMADSGELEEIIAEYINSNALICFDTVADLKAATNLVNGSYARTIGYNNINDGGTSTYKIRTITNEDVIDEAFIIALEDETLVAELIIENNEVNIKQLGAQENADISTYVEKYLAKANQRMNLYIPAGEYLCAETTLNSWFSIKGDSKFVGKTIIRPLTNEQAFVFKIYGIQNWNIEYLHFETGSKAITDSVLILENASFGNLRYLTFQNVLGQAIYINKSFELNFIQLIARHVVTLQNGENSGLIVIKSDSNNIPSTIYFDYIQLEVIAGHIFVVSQNTGFLNNHIGAINIEQNNPSENSTETMDNNLIYKPMTTETDISTYKHLALFKSMNGTEILGLSIDSIDMNNMASCNYDYNGTNYIFDCLFYKDGAENTHKTINANVNNISFIGLKHDFQLLNTRNGATNIVNHKNHLKINNVLYANTNNCKAYFNVNGENNIESPDLTLPSNNYLTNAGFIQCYQISKSIDATNFGNLRYDEKCLSDTKLSVNFHDTVANGNFIKSVAAGTKLLLRYRSAGSTNIVIQDETRNTSKNYAVTTTNNEYVYIELDLTEITDFVKGDILKIGSSAGFAIRLDIMKYL